MPSLASLTARFTIAVVLAGCAAPPNGSEGVPVQDPERVVRSGLYRPVTAPNRGRVVGTVTLDRRAADAVGVTSPAGAEAQALDYDEQPLGSAARVDEAGHFVLEGLETSRDRFVVRVQLTGPRGALRLTAIATAPRKPVDVPVLLNATTTLVADRLRRAQLLGEAEVDALSADGLARLEDVTAAYMETDEAAGVLREADGAFNAFAFDHMTDDHPGLKQLVWTLVPGLLRGWKPTVDRFSAPASPSPLPTAGPEGNRVGPPRLEGVTS
jgi:hypothetical protein